MTVDLVLEDARWQAVDLEGLARRAEQAVLNRLDIAQEAELSLLAANDARIAALNAEFRGKPMPTNVLSWPEQNLTPPAPAPFRRCPRPIPSRA